MYINHKIFKPKRYSSGELKLLKSELNNYIKDNKVNILYENDFSMFELLLIIDYYQKLNVDVDLVLSYLPYQRMDHIDKDELDTVNYVANIFNNLNLQSITICEPHCQAKSFNNCHTLSYVKKLAPKVFEKIKFNSKRDAVILTDKGGLKRYSSLCTNLFYFEKQRDEQTGLISQHHIVGDISNVEKVVIVDDIISTGDTIMNIIEYLSSKKIKEIYVLTGHIEKNKYNLRIINNKNVKKIFSTNSLRKKQTKKLTLYDVKELIYE